MTVCSTFGMKLEEIVGWYGAGAILVAYALVSFKVLSPTGALYQILNLTGAIGIIWISVVKKVYQPAALNVVWALVALVALIQILF